MKIALISPVWFPVPPTGYGGIEWIVWLLADGLVDAGHDVTLFASGDSHTKAKLVSVYETAPSELIGTSIVELHHCLACYERADEFEVVNDHSGPARGGARRRRDDADAAHRPRPHGRDRRRRVRADRAGLAAGRPDLHLHEPAHAEAGPTVGRQLPERARPLALSR